VGQVEEKSGGHWQDKRKMFSLSLSLSLSLSSSISSEHPDNKYGWVIMGREALEPS
jgi:hypothetical protein